MTAPDRRYPIAPLLEATGLSLSALAQRVGIGGGEYARIRSEGVSELAADRWANRMGLNPWEVWPDFGYEECAADGCAATFAPRNSRHRYCSHRCKDRAAKRRQMADPDYRARKQEYLRRYRQEAARAILASKRAWVEANRERVREQNRETTRRWRERKREAA